jgi:hypothetical protein
MKHVPREAKAARCLPTLLWRGRFGGIALLFDSQLDSILGSPREMSTLV